MKFRKKGALSFKHSRNFSRVKSLKSVLNINIEGTRARQKFRREGTPASKAQGHAKNLGTRARQHGRHEGTPKIWACRHEGTPTSMARGHAENLGMRARGHTNIEGMSTRRARHLTDSLVDNNFRKTFHII